METVYILHLETNKYYVGKALDVEKRLQEHINGQGCEWTRTYKPIGIHKVFENCDPFDEDKFTKMCMYDYGMENVRGGSYTDMILSPEIKMFLEREILCSTKKCFFCKREGHFKATCPRLLKNIIPKTNIRVVDACVGYLSKFIKNV